MRNLSLIFLIAKREFLARVRSKVFRLTTVLVPAGILLVAMGSNLMSKRAVGINHLAIVSNNAALAATMKDQLEAGDHPP